MIDEIFDRNYQGARATMHQSFDVALHRIADAFDKSFSALNRIQFDAPWLRRSRSRRTRRA